MTNESRHYLSILSRQYPTEREAATEIINLQAILCLPKSTEHFLSDIHGESEQFCHVLKNGSGTVRRKIEEVIGNSASASYKKMLATLVFYSREKLEIVKAQEADMDDWYLMTLHHLVQVTKSVSSKYTRSKVRKAIPKDFVYVIEELITEKAEVQNKEAYYKEILQTIIRIGEADAVIVALCGLIQRMVIDHLHILGDIFDRGPGPHDIMDTLCAYHSVDIQWGNHDVLWMGAASGHAACIANVIRLSARYGNLDVLEEGYGINLLPLATFALKEYSEADSSCFAPEATDDDESDALTRKMYHAISVIQFKLEAAVVRRNPDFAMQDRLLLNAIDFSVHTVRIERTDYTMRPVGFPTVDPHNPCVLTPEEKMVVERLRHAFVSCEKLQRHVRFLFTNGGLYKTYNGNLLFHGCVPMEADGSFSRVRLSDRDCAGKRLYDALESAAREGFFSREGTAAKKRGGDILWYLWNGPKSPVYGRNKMTTFEQLFLDDPQTWQEQKDPYYGLIDREEIADRILEEFNLSPENAHIINGHVPVQLKKGETPLKCGGKVLMIDGGFSRAYHEKTGISGYTLVSNSRSMRLVAHEAFETTQKAIEEERDIVSDTLVVETFPVRKMVGDTDTGRLLRENIADLEELLAAYHNGKILPAHP